MFKTYCTIVLLAISSLSAVFELCGTNRLFYFSDFTDQLPAGDTIYKYDTVYEYHVIYDTVYIEDTVPFNNTKINNESLIPENDSLNNMKTVETAAKDDTLRKYVSTSGFRKRMDKNIGDIDNSSKDKVADSPELDGGKLIPEPKTSEEQTIRRFVQIPFAFYVKDTLYFADTVLIVENSHDTVFYFQLAPRTDTLIHHQTIIRNRPNLVIVNEIVNVKVQQKNYVFIDESPVKDFYQPLFDLINQNPEAGIVNKSQNTKNGQTHHKKTLRNRFKPVNVSSTRYRSGASPRNGFNNTVDQYLFLKGGGSVIFPQISFSAEQAGLESNINLLNQNLTSETSSGINAGFIYYRNNLGYESGMSFSKHRFIMDYQAEVETVDTSYYWKQFESEKYLYDTTWYIDINHWLATGDTILIPHVDSTLTPFNDSTFTARYDTSTNLVNQKHRFSFSYIEIPLIFRYPVLNGRIFCDAELGIIPAFLIAQSREIQSPESGTIINNQDISFDYDVNISLHGALSVGVKFAERWALLAEPYFRKTLISGLKNQQFKMNTDSWGVQFAITFRL